jgi:glutaredoxin-like protein NrdH
VTITVYTKPACVQCRATFRKLDDSKLDYTKADISVDEEKLEEMKAMGHLSAPVVTVHRDGVLVDSWAGFRPDLIEALNATANRS